MKIIWAMVVLGSLGLIFGLLLSIFDKIFHVEPDTRVEDITKMLPGYNCGACGKPGCSGLAEAIVEENVNPDLCKPGKASGASQKINDYLKNSDINK